TADSIGPWMLAEHFTSTGIALAPVSLGAIVNTSYPYGANDGPVWAGRGLTVVASAGVGGDVGPISFAVAPVAFTASNASFDLLANTQVPNLGYKNGLYPTSIDLPQRFGNSTYSRFDPGESNLRFD